VNRAGFLIGTGFGFFIAGTRLNDYDVIHNMLLLRDFQPWLFMASIVAVAGPLLWLLERRRWQTLYAGPLRIERQPVKRKDILGSVVFGSGWAIAGACPAPAVAMVTGGGLLGIFVMAGLFVGIMLRDAVGERSSSKGDLAGVTTPVSARSC
jgi:uncharacterized protein